MKLTLTLKTRSKFVRRAVEQQLDQVEYQTRQ